MKNAIKEINKELDKWIREDISYEQQVHYFNGLNILITLEQLLPNKKIKIWKQKQKQKQKVS